MASHHIPRSLLLQRCTRACRNPIALRRTGQRRCASTDDAKSFKGQLYDSTAQRLQKERAEQARFAAQRQQGKSWAGGGAALTFVSIAVFYGGYVLGSNVPSPIAPTSTLPLSATIPPKHNLAPTNLEACWTDLRDIVGAENISTDPGDLESHSNSEWASHTPSKGEVPFAVVKPANTEDVSRIMKVCHGRRIPVTAYSGGTSIEGNFASTRGGICIDFSRMDRILALHKEDLDVVVQPAVGWERLNEELAEENLFFPPDPGPGAMIGGMVGTGCSGTNAYRYGTMKEWVISLTMVLADGTVIKTRQRPRKSSAGYDLTRMFIGSEGTLGLVTEAVLKVTVKPIKTSVAVCAFPTLRKAADCCARVVGQGIPVAAVEILDDQQLKFINASGMTSKRWNEVPTLFFKFTGTENGVKEQIALVQNIAKQTGSKSFEFAKNIEEQAELWSARKEALWSVFASKSEDDRLWTTDVAVPISRLAECVAETQKDILDSGLVSGIVGHVGDGNFHAIIRYNTKQRPIAEDVVHRMVKRAIEMEGTATGEHGVGLVKRDYLQHELGQETVDAMRKLKQAFDPLCLLNCDKIVRMQKPKAGEVAEW